MSEQKPELSSAETGSLGTPEVESPDIAPNQEETSPSADAPKVEVKVEAKIEPKLEAPKAEARKG